jgi:carbon storage regulator
MLVLSRKSGERIMVGPEIELTVLGIHKGRVKLGFSGPPEVVIRRDELVEPNRLERARCVSDERES